MSDETFTEAFERYKQQSGNGSVVQTVVMPHFVCTKCRLQFEGKGRMEATCPECGGTYGYFHTPLIRCGTFALAYWLNDFPGEIRQHDSAA